MSSSFKQRVFARMRITRDVRTIPFGIGYLPLLRIQIRNEPDLVLE